MVGDGAGAGDGQDGEVREEPWTPAEQALLEAALDFYGAAEGVIEYTHRERPQVRRDAAGFNAVRDAMRTLEERVVAVHNAGCSPGRIARIARMEQETIEVILRRQSAAPSSDGD